MRMELVCCIRKKKTGFHANAAIAKIVEKMDSRLITAGFLDMPNLDNHQNALYIKTERNGLQVESIWIGDGEDYACHIMDHPFEF